MPEECSTPPADKKDYVIQIGRLLLKHEGKKEFYKPEEVKKAHKESRWSNLDVSCWAMSTYCSKVDFDDYHAAIGEACDYGSMKAEMTLAVTGGASDSWFDVDLSWLEWPDVDLSAIFGFIDF